MTIEEKNLLDWMESTISVIRQAHDSAYRAEEVEGMADAVKFETNGWRFMVGLCALMISKQIGKIDVPIAEYELRQTYRCVALSAIHRGIEVF